MCSPSVNVREQAVWALGNIAGDSAQYRDAIIAAGTVNMLLSQLAAVASLPPPQFQDDSLLFKKNAVWLMSNMCRTRDNVSANLNDVRACFPYLRECLTSDEEDVCSDACWAFVFITDSQKENINVGVCWRFERSSCWT